MDALTIHYFDIAVSLVDLLVGQPLLLLIVATIKLDRLRLGD